MLFKPKLIHLPNINQLYCLLNYPLFLILVLFVVILLCITANCHGLIPEISHHQLPWYWRTSKKICFFCRTKKMNVQVFCLQETFSKPQNEPKWAIEWSAEQAIFNSGTNTPKVDSGTAILLNQPLIKFGPYRKDSEGRIISTEIHCDTFKVQIINIYGYTAAYPKNKRENFFKQLYSFVNPNLPVILCGDSNNVEDPTRDRWPAKNSNRSESKQLSDLIELCKLQDSHKAFDPVGAKFTSCSPATKSRIDRIYASTDIRLISVKVLPNQFSDHEIVITHFEIKYQSHAVKAIGKTTPLSITMRNF